MKLITSIIQFTSLLLVISCGGKTTIDPSNDRSSLSGECAMEKEVCDDALDFQREYNRMPAEQRKEMNSVLNSYIEHCERAKESCDESLKGK